MPSNKPEIPSPRAADDIVDDTFDKVLAELRELAPEPVTTTTGALVPVSPPQPEGTYMTEEVQARVRNLLGIKKESWDRVMPEVNGLIPRYATQKITARMSLNMGFENLAQLAQAVELGKKIMENDKNEAITRVAAGKMVGHGVEAMSKMFAQLISLSGIAGDKTAADDAVTGPPKPKNLPPQFNVQVNVAPNSLPVGSVVRSGNGVRNLPPEK